MVSAMQIHSEPAYRLIRDAWQLGDNRPLILAGGPKAVYEPWDFFGLSPDGREAPMWSSRARSTCFWNSWTGLSR